MVAFSTDDLAHSTGSHRLRFVLGRTRDAPAPTANGGAGSAAFSVAGVSCRCRREGETCGMNTTSATQLDFLAGDFGPAVASASVPIAERAEPVVAAAPLAGACGSTANPTEGRPGSQARERVCGEEDAAGASRGCGRRQDCFRGDERATAAASERRSRGNERERGERETMNGILTAELIGDRLLRINEVADCLRSSDKTVRRLICAGKLRSLKVRGLRLVRASDLRALVEGATS